ncbi:glutamate receptor-like protein [Dinothrombium tinctorium]|uniref:Glutamate receptor-like protein n=1 Tax=Dinothrombium tinctorium TaxID=1965070 RepID=A0A3S3NQU1_9ACAR|nr:glutamate receptor-like protein [Dinothrombium tinctorium]
MKLAIKINAVWYFFTFLLYSLYIAQLVNIIQTTNTQKPPLASRSISDLVGEPEVSFALVKNGSTESLFKESKIFAYNKIFESIELKNFFIESYESGLKRVRSDPNFVFVMEQVANDDYQQQLPCDLINIGETVIERGYGLATPIGSHLGLLLNQVLLDLQEEGVLRELRKKWWTKKILCDVSECVFLYKSKFPLGIKNLKPRPHSHI